MSERDTYPPGVPCWVDTLQPDLEAATAFYGALMGWTFDGGMPVDGHWSYYVAQLNGGEVAGIAPLPPMAPDTQPGWATQVRVADLDEAVKAVSRAGGSVVLESFDAAPAGRLAVVADPGGATICLWEALAREGATRINEPGTWAMSVLSSADTERAKAFYADAFGWTTEAFSAGGAGVTLFRLPGYVGGEPAQPVSREVVAVMAPRTDGAADHWTVDFWINDVDAAVARAEQLGGSILRRPTDSPAGRSALLADPAGAVFTVTQAPHARN
jgi:predicted enzyme related to lactoylglutathione lyase